MQKLKYVVLKKMIEKKLTSAEINFIIHISHYQDDSGKVLGVYYKNIMESLHISIQTFYDILRSLDKKGIIQYEKNFYSDWDIQILDNDFTNMEIACKEGYLSMQHNIFCCEEFQSLKAGAKLLAMDILKINLTKEGASYTKSGSYVLRVSEFYNKYINLFGTTKRVIQYYLTELRKWFSIGIKNGMYYITPLQKVYRKNGTSGDAKVYQEHIGKVACRRERLKFTNETFKDAATLATQFAKRIKDGIKKARIKADSLGNIFLDAVKKSIERANETCKDKYKWKRELQPKLVNKCIMEIITEMGF